MRSASPSRSNLSRHICGPAKSQGRSPIRVDRGRRPVAYLLLTRSRCGLLAGPSWVERRHSPKATANGEVAPIPDLLALANGRFEPLQTCIVLLVPPTPLTLLASATGGNSLTGAMIQRLMSDHPPIALSRSPNLGATPLEKRTVGPQSATRRVCTGGLCIRQRGVWSSGRCRATRYSLCPGF